MLQVLTYADYLEKFYTKHFEEHYATTRIPKQIV